MNRFGQGAAAALFFSVILPSAAAAQDKAPTAPATASADDWDMIRDPAKKTVAAYVSLDSGVSVILRCTNKVYDALVAGLPGALGDTRVLHLSYGDHSHPETWNVATSPTVAMSALPAPFARKLRDGGMLSIMTPDGAGPGRNLTHHLHLPASSTAVDETLTACEKPLEDPRDALLPDLGEGGLSAGVTWERPPRPNYPALARYSAGFAMLSCMALPDGRVNDCVVESEFPADGGFGRATLSSVRDARLKASDGAPITPRLIVFRTNFMMR
jgi:hypothetical protein